MIDKDLVELLALQRLLLDFFVEEEDLESPQEIKAVAHSSRGFNDRF